MNERREWVRECRNVPVRDKSDQRYTHAPYTEQQHYTMPAHLHPRDDLHRGSYDPAQLHELARGVHAVARLLILLPHSRERFLRRHCRKLSRFTFV